MKNEIVPFGFEGNEIRVAKDEITGEFFWVAKDICDVLGYSDTEVTLRKLDDDEKLTRKIYGAGQQRDMMCINESGLYALILRSNKPQAKVFKKWVTSEMLPTIRKTGKYEIRPQTRKITKKAQTLLPEFQRKRNTHQCSRHQGMINMICYTDACYDISDIGIGVFNEARLFNLLRQKAKTLSDLVGGGDVKIIVKNLERNLLSFFGVSYIGDLKYTHTKEIFEAVETLKILTQLNNESLLLMQQGA